LPEPTLTERQLNRALLGRQLLLERVDLSLPRALERVGGLQTQYAPTGYIGLWSRVAGFERNQLTKALERGSVVQGTLMRATIHMVSRRDYPLFAAGVRDARRDWWLGLARRGLDAHTLRATARRVRSLLAHSPLGRTEIMERLGLNSVMWNGVGMCVDLLRVPPSGTWDRRRADLFAERRQL